MSAFTLYSFFALNSATTAQLTLNEKAGKFIGEPCVLELHAVFLRYLRLQAILLANARIFTCVFASRTSGGLHVVYMQVKWDLPAVQVILPESHRQFFLFVVSNFSWESGQTARRKNLKNSRPERTRRWDSDRKS